MTGNEMAKIVSTAAEILLYEEIEYSLGLDDDHLHNYMVDRRIVPVTELGPAQEAGGRFCGRSGDGGYILDFDVSEEDAQAALDSDLEAHRKRSAELLTLANWLATNYGEKVLPWLAPSG